MKKFRIIALLTIFSLTLAGCGDGVKTPETGTPTGTVKPQATVPAEVAEDTNNMEPQTPPPLNAEQEQQLKTGEAPHKATNLTFNIIGGNFYFVPSEIRVKKGDKVVIIFTDAGGSHNFTLDEFKVNLGPIQKGETATAEFLANKKGTFEYYCSIGEHRKLGQKGTLIVE